MARGRHFTAEFKFAIVAEIERRERTVAAICREHELVPQVVQRWRHEVARRGEAAFSRAVLSEAEAQTLRIAELERLVGQLTLENAALKKGLQTLHLRNVTR